MRKTHHKYFHHLRSCLRIAKNSILITCGNLANILDAIIMSDMSRAAQEPTQKLEEYGVFEAYLTEAIPEATLMKYERVYIKATKEEKITNQATFDYAVCLIKSRYASDINRGLLLMEDLTLSHPQGNREYLYFLAIGYARLKDYTLAIDLLKASLKVEPESSEVTAFKEFLEYKMKKDAKKGLVVTTGAALVVGGVVGLGLALLKLRR
ncbi:mitochondrial fission 1 protein-like [Bradysia coprophila]|uniref:mitochondrial fission 1 protein-like n=1 Tax=Bradysia coprophila TaxID=38358 RepID=UPI00187DB073|nr:mitochondrial fission 1 protein-like [Bradysia coprophila]